MLIVLCLLIALAGQCLGDREPSWTFEDLYDGNVKKIETLSEIRKINIQTVQEYKSGDRMKISMLDLQDVAISNARKRICDTPTGEYYLDMHRDHLGAFHIDFPMPSVAQKFTKAMGHQIVGQCKAEMAKQMTRYETVVPEEQQETIRRLESAGAVLIDDQTQFEGTDVVSVAAQLWAVLNDDVLKEAAEANFTVKHADALNKYASDCRILHNGLLRFMVKTTMTMINLGYDYPAAGGADPAPAQRRWLNVALTCRALSAINQFKTSGYRTIHFGSNKILVNSQVPDKLIVDRSEAKRTAASSMAAAKTIAQSIYKKVLGANFSLVDRVSMNGKRFLNAIVTYLDDKLDKSA